MDIERAYQETLDYLYSFVDYSLQKNLQYSPEKFTLDRIRAFTERLGNPQERYQTLHVAGSKGKGSVTALCASVLQTEGYRVGEYISPHLSDYNERIQVNGVPIPHADLVEIVNRFKPQIESIPKLSTFDITTALAFQYFAEQEVDLAVIEVGLGGRLDATNIIQPKVAVITSLVYEHTNLLGNTLTQIATEKGGIIKPGVPVVLSLQKEEARQTIEQIAAERNSRLIQIGQDYLFAPVSHSLEGQTFLVWSKEEQDLLNEYIEAGDGSEWNPTRLRMPLLGYHQVENAATAYAALETLKEEGIRISERAIVEGFERVKWPGRFEVLRKKPPLIVDSAHTRESALKLRLAMEDYFPGLPVILVFGASEDKDIEGMFVELAPRIRKVIATKANHPRALEPKHLADLAYRFGRSGFVIDNPVDALDMALHEAGSECAILVAGSIFIAAEARDAWFRRNERMPERR